MFQVQLDWVVFGLLCYYDTALTVLFIIIIIFCFLFHSTVKMQSSISHSPPTIAVGTG